MPTYTGTAGNDSWTVVNPGTFTLDGLGGIDTMYLGTSLRSSYKITQTADGAVHVDTVSGASGVLRATLFNMEKLVFNSQRDTLDLSTYFGDKTAPTAILALTGSAGNDVFTALAGHQSIDGLAGTDTLQLNLALSAFTLTPKGAGFTVTANDGSGTYDLSNIERLNFSDKSVALDTAATQAGGQTELLLGAVLGKTLLATKAPLIGAVIGLFDQGYTFQTLSGAIMRLPIWDILTGQANPSSSDVASYLLTRVNGVAPDPATLASAIAALNAQADMAHGQGDFLWQLAASPANQIQVDLVGLAATGIIYGGV